MLVGAQQGDGQLAEQLGCAAFYDPSRTGDRQVLALLSGLAGRQDGHGNVGIAPDVAQLLVVAGQMSGHQLVAFGCGLQGNPHHGHLWGAVGIDGDECGISTRPDECARGVMEFHVW